MPYITPQERTELDDAITALGELIRSEPERQDGRLNYAVTRLVHMLYGERYFECNRALGVLSAVQAEYYRRVVAPYEDKKIAENGDVA